MGHDAFISYAAEDQVVANAVCAKLEERGIRCWIAPRDVRAGNFAEQLVDAQKECKVVVLVFSKHANRSADVKREVENAFAEEKTVIPFRIENIVPANSLLYYMRSVHWLDAVTPPLEAHIQKLASEVSWQLNAPPKDVPAPRSIGRRDPARLPAKSTTAVAALAVMIVTGAVSLMIPKMMNGPAHTPHLESRATTPVVTWSPASTKELTADEKQWLEYKRRKAGLDPNAEALSLLESQGIAWNRNPRTEIAEPQFIERARR